MVAIVGVALPLVTWLAVEVLQGRKTVSAQVEEISQLRLPGRLDQGLLYLGIGEASEAELVFEEVLDHDRSSTAIAGMTMALLAQNRAAEAMAVLDRESDSSGPDRVLDRLRAEALRIAGDIKQAEQIEATLKLPREPIEMYIEAVRLLYERPIVIALPEGPHLSLEGYGPSLFHSRLATPRGLRLDENEDSIRQYRRRAAEAVELLLDAIAIENREPFWFALCWAAWAARDADVAERYSDAIERHAETGLDWFYVGLAREVYDEASAIEAFERAALLDDRISAAIERRAVLLLGRGRVQDAVDLMQVAVEDVPERATYRVAYSSALLYGGRLVEAEAEIRKALQLDPDLVSAYDILGGVLYLQRRLEEASAAYSTAVEGEPTGARLHSDLGQVLYELGEPERAEEHLEEALRLAPEHPYPTFSLGVIRKRSSEYEAAIALHLDAIRYAEKPEFSSFPVDRALGSLGNCYEWKRDFESAMNCYRRAHEMVPDEPRHRLNLGLMLYRQEDDRGRSSTCSFPSRRA